jgi:hypothetical protein
MQQGALTFQTPACAAPRRHPLLPPPLPLPARAPAPNHKNIKRYRQVRKRATGLFITTNNLPGPMATSICGALDLSSSRGLQGRLATLFSKLPPGAVGRWLEVNTQVGRGGKARGSGGLAGGGGPAAGRLLARCHGAKHLHACQRECTGKRCCVRAQSNESARLKNREYTHPQTLTLTCIGTGTHACVVVCACLHALTSPITSHSTQCITTHSTLNQSSHPCSAHAIPLAFGLSCEGAVPRGAVC